MRGTGLKECNTHYYYYSSAYTIILRSICEIIMRAFAIDAIMTRLIKDTIFNELLLTRETQIMRNCVYLRARCAREQVHVTQVGFRCKCRLRAYKIAHLPRSCGNARATYSKSVPRATQSQIYNNIPRRWRGYYREIAVL